MRLGLAVLTGLLSRCNDLLTHNGIRATGIVYLFWRGFFHESTVW